MPKDTKTLGNNKARAWESLGFAHKKRLCQHFDTTSPFLAHHFAHIVIIYNSPISVSLRKSITFMIDMPSVFT